MKRLAIVMAFALVAMVGCKKKDAQPSAGSATAAGSGSAAKPVDPGSAQGSADPGSAAPGSADPGSAAPGSAAAAPTGRPASVTDDMVATADKMVAAVDGLAADLKAAGTDCKKASTAMKARFDEIAKVATELEKLKPVADKDPAAKDWMKATYNAKMETSVNTMMASAMACKDDKEFVATLQKFPLAKKKDAKKTP